MQHQSPVRGWSALFHQWGKDIQLWLYILLTLELFRPLLIATFHDKSNQWTAVELWRALWTGLRFDLSTAAMWVLPTFLLSLLVLLLPAAPLLERLRRWVGYGYVAVAMFAFGADLVYFSEYNDQFNQHIFGLFHDDTIAILITIWRHYHPIPVLLAVALLIYFNVNLLRRWLAYTPFALAAPSPLLPRVALTIGLFLFIAAMGRGGTLWGETILLKHAFVTNDLFLNRTVINPFTALYQAIEIKWRAEQKGGIAAFWPENKLAEAVALVRSARNLPAQTSGNLDEDLTQTAHSTSNPPRHIFLMLLESHDGWPVMPAYRHFGFSPRIADLAERGIYFPNFLASTSGTIGSLSALVTGMPDTKLNINHEASASKPYPSAIAETFKRLGYRTRFYYGGYLGWQRLDTFALSQGFDEIWGGGSMVKEGQHGNEWGVSDEYIYDFILRTVDDDQPSFNLILSTSNHPPYDIDLKAAGFPYTELPKPLVATKDDTLRILGHLWYADQQVGRFVANAEQQYPKALFAITGDHTTRLNLRFEGNSVAESVAVPFVLYGPQVLGKRAGMYQTPGAHIDIPTTLIGLSAPSDFRYVAYGRDLLSPPEQAYGFGYEYFVGKDFISAYRPGSPAFPLPGVDHTDTATAPESVQREYNALQALSWYRIRRGPNLPTATTQQ